MWSNRDYVQSGGWYRPAAAGGGVNNIAQDGTPTHANSGGAGTTAAITMNATAGSSNIFFVATWAPSGLANVSSVVSSAGAPSGWAQITQQIGNNTELWYTTATSPQAGGNVTVTWNTSLSFAEAMIFSFSGVNTVSPFDGSVLKGTTAQSITTTNAADAIIGVFSPNAGSASPGTSFSTILDTANFLYAERFIVSPGAIQTGLSVDIASAGAFATTIVQAIKST